MGCNVCDSEEDLCDDCGNCEKHCECEEDEEELDDDLEDDEKEKEEPINVEK